MATKVWRPTDKTLRNVISRVREGDAIANPVCSVKNKRHLSKTEYDAAYRLADKIDDALRERGMKIDHPALCVGVVEKARR